MEHANSLDFSKSIYCLITGASRGIGQTIAIEFAKKIQKQSTFLLLAQSESKLNETKQQILNLNKNINVITESINLTEPTKQQLEQIVESSLGNHQFETAVIIHNAGTVGHVNKKAVELNDLEDWKKYFSLNFFTVTVLNSVFIENVRKFTSNIYVVNITSLAGRRGMPSMGQYGSGKAARDLFFRVLAIEEEDICVLNYSPGPVKTDMVSVLLNNSVDDGTRKFFKTIIDEKSILTTDMTVSKFLSLLEGGNYKSGTIIDYYD